MRIPARPPRAAFTILEVILATSIALLVLVGLYAAFGIHLKSTEVGRNLVDEANQARGIFNRITADVNSNLPPLDTRYNTAINYPNGNIIPIGTAAAALLNPPSTTTTTTTTPTTTTTQSSSNSSNTTPATPAGIPYTFNLMVQGSSTNLTLYNVLVPREALDTLKNTADNTYLPPVLADLRMVSFFLVDGKGLARQEIRMVTSQNDIATMPPNVADDDPNTTYFGANAKSVQFQYFDGANWQDSWDGTVISMIDNVTPQGPPMAIAITVVMPRPGGGDRTYRHVVAIQTANNLNPVVTNGTTPTTPTTSP